MAQYQLKWTTGRLALERKCVTKMIKRLMKFCKIDDFSKMIPDQLESILTSKKQYFKAKNDDFETKIRARAPQLETRSGIRKVSCIE